MKLVNIALLSIVLFSSVSCGWMDKVAEAARPAAIEVEKIVEKIVEVPSKDGSSVCKTEVIVLNGTPTSTEKVTCVTRSVDENGNFLHESTSTVTRTKNIKEVVLQTVVEKAETPVKAETTVAEDTTNAK